MPSEMNSGKTSSGSAVHCEWTANFTNFNSDYDERNNHHIDADNVAILGTSDDKLLASEPMSTQRRCCFIASLLLCVFSVVGFVWLLPCSEESACPARVDRIKTHNWFNNYTRIELKGGVHVVNGIRGWEKNLIFLYRGDFIFPDTKRNNIRRNGIVSLIGSSGAVAWYKETADEQVAIDCKALDVDANGNRDCLVLDEHGQLGALNPISGQWYWRYLGRSLHKYGEEDFPLMLPDLDGDGVLELLIVSSANVEQRLKNGIHKGDISKTKRERNTLRILSGRSGKPIGSDLRLHDCDVIRGLYLDSLQMISFICVYNETETKRLKTLPELFALITNKANGAQRLAGAAMPRVPQRRKVGVQHNVYTLSGRELLVANSGRCPEDCSVTIVLSETRNGKVNVIRNFTKSGMYGMTPVPWSFKNTGKPTSGFVMKFWKWNVDAKTASSNAAMDALKARQSNMPTSQAVEAKTKAHNSKNANKAHVSKNFATVKNNNSTANKTTERHGRTKRSDFNGHLPAEFNDLDQFIERRQAYTLADKSDSMMVRRVARNVGNITNNLTKPSKLVGELLPNYKMQLITESVILVLFIGADTRIENTSQSNIMQFCPRRSNYTDRNEVLCQPDLSSQEDSILIADLDQDGSQELISYTSTFVADSDSGTDYWKLITFVRLVRLQAELPILYDTQFNN